MSLITAAIIESNEDVMETNKPTDSNKSEREPECRECSAWFLGCLNGRETWKDKPIRPNFRNVTLRDGSIGGLCDAFQLDPNPNRHGRVVYDDDKPV